jgi:uncharacterized cupin superfamily protein
MLAGSLTITASNGTERTLCAGDVILLDDMGAKGHLTRVNGSTQVVAVGVRVPDVR